jgi:hypothetical protein
MVQTILTYAAVVLAAAWVIWSLLLPKSARLALRTRIAPRRRAAAPSGRGKPGCDCEGGCGD